MSDTVHFLSLAAATFILGLSPGPAVFATLSCALTTTRRNLILFILGILSGDVVFALLAMGGLATLTAQIPLLFRLIQYAGGAYLIYLGGRGLLQNLRQGQPTAFTPTTPAHPSGYWAAGFLLTASNPKDLLFFVSFLPAFIDLHRATLWDMGLASLTIAVTFLLTLGLYAGLATWAREQLNHPRLRHWLDRGACVLLVIIGLIILSAP